MDIARSPKKKIITSSSMEDPLGSSFGASKGGSAKKASKGKGTPGGVGSAVALGGEGGEGREEAATPEPRDVDDDWERPPGAEPFHDADFCVEDEACASLCDQVARLSSVSNPHRSGNPLSWVSRGFENLVGYPEEECLGRNCSFLHGAETEEAGVAELRKGMEALEAVRVPLTNYRKDGASFKNLVGVYPVLDAEGALFRFFGTQFNLTERARQRADKGEPGEDPKLGRLEEVAGRLAATYAVVDASQPTQPVLWASKELEVLTGYASEDLAGLSVLSLQGPDSQWSGMQEVNGAIHHRRRGSTRLILHRKDGTPFQAYVHVVPLVDRVLGGGGGGASHMMVQFCETTSKRRGHVGHYLLGRVVGRGASGVVRIARKDHRRGRDDDDGLGGEREDGAGGSGGGAGGKGELVAIKAIDTSKFKSIAEIDSVQAEMQILERIKHANVVNMLDVMYQHDHIHIVMEYASGGSLMRRIYHNRLKRLEEPEAWRLFDQIVSALNYCHRRLIVHRDLKPENLLLDGEGNIKIADFGLSAIVSPFMQGLSTTVGTPEFTAPEIIQGDEYNGESVDIWSLGVILYEFVCGSLPFQAPDMDALFDVVLAGKFDCPAHMGEDCEDLIRLMLDVNPRSRITLGDIIQHPWYRAHAREAEGGEEDDGLGDLSDEEEGEPRAGRRSSDAMHSSARLQIPADFLASMKKEAAGEGPSGAPEGEAGAGSAAKKKAPASTPPRRR